jgi:hypothetical protein
MRNTRTEQMFSASPPTTDILRRHRNYRFVPNADMVNGIFTKKNRRKAASQFRLMFVDHAAINAGLRLPAIKDCKSRTRVFTRSSPRECGMSKFSCRLRCFLRPRHAGHLAWWFCTLVCNP